MARSPNAKRLTLLAATAMVGVLAVVWLYRREIRAQYLLSRDFESLGRNEQGYSEYRHRKTGIVFVGVPGGAFLMGSPEDEEGAYPFEHPQHEVMLSPFLIAKHEVTQEKWEKLIRSNPSNFKGQHRPVERTRWDECQEFCEKTGLSLPTEAQWEYACRAGRRGPFAGTGKLKDMGWYRENSGDTTHPVGQKNPNAFGLYDMHGNVMEWCYDFCDRDFYRKTEATMRDPICASESIYRVLRGGSYSSGERYCRSANRSTYEPLPRSPFFGFRPAYNPYR